MSFRASSRWLDEIAGVVSFNCAANANLANPFFQLNRTVLQLVKHFYVKCHYNDVKQRPWCFQSSVTQSKHYYWSFVMRIHRSQRVSKTENVVPSLNHHVGFHILLLLKCGIAMSPPWRHDVIVSCVIILRFSRFFYRWKLRLVWCQRCRHWWHRRLSLTHMILTVTTKLTTWSLLVISVYRQPYSISYNATRLFGICLVLVTSSILGWFMHEFPIFCRQISLYRDIIYMYIYI